MSSVLFNAVLIFSDVCAFIKASLVESDVAICNAKSAEFVTFSNAGKVSFISCLGGCCFFQKRFAMDDFCTYCPR